MDQRRATRAEKGWVRVDRAGAFQTYSEEKALSGSVRKERRTTSGDPYIWGLDDSREDGKE